MVAMDEYSEKENANPTVYAGSIVAPSRLKDDLSRLDEPEGGQRDEIDAAEVFDLIRCINDPEHPLTLEQLKVATLDQIEVDDAKNELKVRFTPTIPHCSMATLIGLSIRVKLLRSLPRRFKVTVFIHPGTHASEEAVNKQLNDKERVAAALENAHLIGVVNKCLHGSDGL